MTMQLRVKSSGEVISDTLDNRSGRVEDFHRIPYRTLGGVIRHQKHGVRYWTQRVTLRFSPSYPNSNNTGYLALVEAARTGTTLVFTDVAGVERDVKIYEWDPDAHERVEEIPHKDVRRVSLLLFDPAYTAA